MFLLSLLVNTFPYILGTWILRSTNDNTLSENFSYLTINNDNTIKFRTLSREGLFGIKKSRSGIIKNITVINDNDYFIRVKYSHTNKYSYSILGIEIPEYKSEQKHNLINRSINLKIIDKSILIRYCNSPLYYLFDLHVGKIGRPFIETRLNTFLFTQFISFFLNLILANIIHRIVLDL